MGSAKTNPAFMTGVPELLILRLLATQEMYGYELVRAIGTATGQVLTLGEGVVYPALHALEVAKCLKSRRRTVDGRERVYYSVTAAGQRRLDAVVSDWMRITRAVQGVLEGVPHAA